MPNHYELLPYLSCSPDSASRDYLLLAYFKKWCDEKRFGSNDDIFAPTKDDFLNIDKSYHLVDVKNSETLDGEYETQRRLRWQIKHFFVEKPSFCSKSHGLVGTSPYSFRFRKIPIIFRVIWTDETKFQRDKLFGAKASNNNFVTMYFICW